MKTYFLLIYFGVLHDCFANNTNFSEEYDLTNIFLPSFRKEKENLPQIPGVIYKNISVDIENLDVDKMKKKLENMMQTQVMDMEDIKETRRQSLVYSFGTGIVGHISMASDFMTRSKIADLMLQTIYMARHKMKALEEDPLFKKTDTGYRIGYLYKMMRRIMKKLRDILHLLSNDYKECWGVKNNWPKTNWLHEKDIILHTKAVKLHNDFLYMYWVMIKVDALYMEAWHQKPKLPKSLQNTGGITDDEPDHILKRHPNDHVHENPGFIQADYKDGPDYYG